MKYQFFAVSAFYPDETQQKLNNFCNSHRIANVEKQFVANGDQSYWSFCVTYLDSQQKLPFSKKNKVDYREVLNEQDFAVYAKLRELRKKLSEQENIPAYSVFTNEQLAAMIQQRVRSLKAMEKIDGIGSIRLEKYRLRFALGHTSTG